MYKATVGVLEGDAIGSETPYVDTRGACRSIQEGKAMVISGHLPFQGLKAGERNLSNKEVSLTPLDELMGKIKEEPTSQAGR